MPTNSTAKLYDGKTIRTIYQVIAGRRGRFVGRDSAGDWYECWGESWLVGSQVWFDQFRKIT